MEQLQKEIECDESEDELTTVAGVVKTTKFEPRPGDDKDDSDPVGVRMDPCLLADPYVVSCWVEKRLGNVGSVKVKLSRILMIFCVSANQRERAPCNWEQEL